MDFQLIYSTFISSLPIIYAVGILNWFVTMAICILKFKKLVKIELGNDYKNEIKKVKTVDVIDFMYNLAEECRFSYLLTILYFISGLMALGSVLILLDSTKAYYCISYITLPTIEIIRFKMAKCKLKEKLIDDEEIKIKRYLETQQSYKIIID